MLIRESDHLDSSPFSSSSCGLLLNEEAVATFLVHLGPQLLAVSLGLGYALYSIYSGLADMLAGTFQVSAGIIASVVLSYMIVWMARSARKVKGEIEGKIDVAVTAGNLIAISTVAFASVGREGLETVLFLAPFIGGNLIGVGVGGSVGISGVVILLYLLARRIYHARVASVLSTPACLWQFLLVVYSTTQRTNLLR